MPLSSAGGNAPLNALEYAPFHASSQALSAGKSDNGGNDAETYDAKLWCNGYTPDQQPYMDVKGITRMMTYMYEIASIGGCIISWGCLLRVDVTLLTLHTSCWLARLAVEPQTQLSLTHPCQSGRFEFVSTFPTSNAANRRLNECTSSFCIWIYD